MVAQLASVNAKVSYLSASEERPKYRIYPPSSGRESTSPVTEPSEVEIFDFRPVIADFTLDGDGVILRRQDLLPGDYTDPEYVTSTYYPLMRSLVMEVTGAREVIVFDHNTRSADSSRRMQSGSQPPVPTAHGDYTLSSGPRRLQEVLREHDRGELAGGRSAIINVWRPLKGPVQDTPLAMCDPRTVKDEELVDTPIEHYSSGDLDTPSHVGSVYSVRSGEHHRWGYVSAMTTDEILIFKTFDSKTDVATRLTLHSAFNDPTCPAEFQPRESIEVRTAVFY